MNPKQRRLSDGVVRLVSRRFERMGAVDVPTGAFNRIETWARHGVTVYLAFHRDPLATPGYQILAPVDQAAIAAPGAKVDAMFAAIDQLIQADDLGRMYEQERRERDQGCPPASVTTGTDAPNIPDEILRKGP